MKKFIDKKWQLEQQKLKLAQQETQKLVQQHQKDLIKRPTTLVQTQQTQPQQQTLQKQLPHENVNLKIDPKNLIPKKSEPFIQKRLPQQQNSNKSSIIKTTLKANTLPVFKQQRPQQQQPQQDKTKKTNFMIPRSKPLPAILQHTRDSKSHHEKSSAPRKIKSKNIRTKLMKGLFPNLVQKKPKKIKKTVKMVKNINPQAKRITPQINHPTLTAPAMMMVAMHQQLTLLSLMNFNFPQQIPGKTIPNTINLQKPHFAQCNKNIFFFPPQQQKAPIALTHPSQPPTEKPKDLEGKETLENSPINKSREPRST